MDPEELLGLYRQDESDRVERKASLAQMDKILQAICAFANDRSALLAADFVAVPVSPDLFSLQGLKNLGPTLVTWREHWQARLTRRPSREGLDLPDGTMRPIGYIVLQHAVRLDRPVKAYDRWIRQIPQVYRTQVLGQSETGELNVQRDANCLAVLKNYRSLMPLAQEARKPIFMLKPADGAIGSHLQAAQRAHGDLPPWRG